jgi:dTDP-4-amino-4,6-dideoxygalactose transaminase/nucleoside-diphosphate-sugar epimerase
MKRLLVVGGSGFIGYNVAARAVVQGWQVTTINRRPGRKVPAGVEALVLDLRSGVEVTTRLQGRTFDAVVYCAGDVDHAGFFASGGAAFASKLVGTVNLIAALDRKALVRYVNIDSSTVYGHLPSPQREDQLGSLDTPYALANAQTVDLLANLGRCEGFPAVTLRVFQAYGPGQDLPRLVPAAVADTLAKGVVRLRWPDYRRDFVYIDDVVAAVFLAIAQPVPAGEVCNISAGRGVSNRSIVSQIQARLGAGRIEVEEAGERRPENPDLYGDNSKARRILGWTPVVILEEGLERTVRAANLKPEAPAGAGATPLRVSRSSITALEKARVLEVLDAQYLGMGAEVRRFEQKLTEFFGRRALCVVNGTAALHLALQAAGIGPGDEVLVPSLTYIATFQAISAAGAVPVACDVGPKDLVLDWHDAERRVTARTRAVMPVYYSGNAGDIDGLYAFARRHGLRVIEDAAHAFGTTHAGRRIGSFGDVSCFSFDGIKNITCGEGGCIVTDDTAVIQAASDARLLAVAKDSDRRYAGERSWDFDVTDQGWRYHMSNIMAAIGLAQLERFPALAEKRQRLASAYVAALSGHPRLAVLQCDYRTVVPHIFVVRIAGLADREALRAAMLRAGIETGIHYKPNHLLTRFRRAGVSLPVTEAAYPELLTLPLHPEMSETDVGSICETLRRLI